METIKQLVKDRIQDLDYRYLLLRDTLGSTHPDTFYVKGQRDALLELNNTLTLS